MALDRVVKTPQQDQSLCLSQVLKSTHPEPGLPQAETGTRRLAPLLPEASQESPLPSATEGRAALPGCEMAPSAHKAGGALQPQRSSSSSACSGTCSPAARCHPRDSGRPAQAPGFQVPCLRPDNATRPAGNDRRHRGAAGGNGPALAPPLPVAMALGAQTGLCHFRGRMSSARCRQLTPQLPQAGKSSAKPVQTFSPFARPTAAVPGGAQAHRAAMGRPRATQ